MDSFNLKCHNAYNVVSFLRQYAWGDSMIYHAKYGTSFGTDYF